MPFDPDFHLGPGSRRQREVFLDGVAGRTPAVPVAPDALAEAARRAMSPAAWAYVAGGAGLERTQDANRAAFDRWALVPRQLAGTDERDLSTTVLGARHPAPLMLAPIGVLEEAHAEADLAVARAAAAEGVPFVFSSQASVPMEACAEDMDAVRPGAPRLFQLYWSTDDDLVRSFVQRAERCGCSAVVLTLDTTLLGWRPRDLDLAALPFLQGKGIAQYTSDPVFLSKLDHPLPDAAAAPPLSVSTVRAGVGQARRFPGPTGPALTSGRARKAVQRFVGTYSRPSLGWAQVDQLRAMTRLPIVLKGVLHPDDAREAVRHGVDAVVVSTHGGRQVDASVAALDALPAVVEAVGSDLEVWFDSGVRGGADVALALGLGARAVLLGRPYVYGLAVAGERGVREVIRNVLAELDLTLGLVGARSLADLPAAVVRRGGAA
ncbi:alpha-hydroxy-acid oxidizing protein [Rubrivirga sp. S365]|uniref:alpha-hydroxy-acid oxidizing protein n=1 Tax=Rubrivirga sp. S365 TaxID=3076080 RepID=UPI0028CA22B5|nr:alpha-hydroxy-acid oxidizing protein [Rubrivirga sp. S365]MDT7856233.1 alpha-hydroxy-acid oxidizing protein [Rubrivirga sp. S365]